MMEYFDEIKFLCFQPLLKIVSFVAFVQNMVMTFRVSELQLLLGLTSQSRCGRKTELMERALALVDRGVSVPVQQKIRELYQRFIPKTTVQNSYSQNLLGSQHGNHTFSFNLCFII